MKLQKLTLQMIDDKASREVVKNELENLLPKISDCDKVETINIYLCFSNLFEMETNYLEHCVEFKDCIRSAINCIKRNRNKMDSNICDLIVEVFEFNLSYVNKNKVVQLIA